MALKQDWITEPQDVPLAETFGAAFELENDVVNFVELLRRGPIEADPNYSPAEDARKSDLWITHGDALLRARSRQEFLSFEKRIKDENAKRELLAAQGATGIMAGMAAGLLSPTILIPLVGPARGAKGVAQAFALAGAAATAQEVPLILNQLARTPEESALSIGASTVLGGLLGSGAVYLRSSALDRMARELEGEAGEPPVLFRSTRGEFVRADEAPELVVPRDLSYYDYSVDNPGGRWLAGKVAEVETRMAESDSLQVKRGITGSITATMGQGNPLYLPVTWLKQFRALNDEVRKAGDVKYDDLRAAVDKEGFDPAQKGNRIVLAVNHKGVPYIMEGNTRLAVAADVGEKFVKAEVRWWNGGEAVEGGLTPEKILKQAEEQPTPSTVGAKQRTEQFRPFIRDIDPETGEESIRYLSDTETANAVGEMAPATLLGRIASWSSPVLRGINQFDQPVKALRTRGIFQQLSDSGVAMSGNEQGLVGALGGTIEHRLGYYQGLLANAYKYQHQAYIRYLYGNDEGLRARAATNLRMELNKAPPGKLTWQEFKENVADAMNLGDDHEIAEVADVAKYWRSEFFDKFNEAMDEVAAETGLPRLYRQIEEDFEKSYFRHQFAPEKVAQSRGQFIADIAEHYLHKLNERFGRAATKLMAKAEDDLAYADILRMTREEAEAEMVALRETLEGMKDPASYDEVATLRLEARNLVSDKLDELEKANTNKDPEVTSANRRLAKQEVKEEFTRLMERANDLESRIPKKEMAARDTRAKLRRRMRRIRESYGALEAKQAATFAKIEKLEEQNLDAFERVVTATQKYTRRTDKFDFAKWKKNEVRKWKAALRSEFALLQRLEADDPEAVAKAREELTALNEKIESIVARTKLGEEEAFATLRDALDRTISYVNRVNNRRAERIARLRDQAKELDPKQVKVKVDSLIEMRLRQMEDLEDRIRAAGGVDVSIRPGAFRFDFAETAKDIATDLANRITGNHTRIAQLDTMQDLRSPMKMRVLDLPYEVKRKYLELDTEKVATRYAQTVGSDIELYRAFGAPDGSTALRAIQEEFNMIEEGLRAKGADDKTLGKIATARKRRVREFTALVERVRGIRGLPDDPSALPYRLGRLFMNWNVTTMMGTSAITSIPDASRAVFAHGMTNVFRDAWAPFIKGLVSEGQNNVNKELIKQLKLFGIGMDVYTQNRARGTFDIAGSAYGAQTAVERFFDYTAAKTPQVAMFGPWTDWNKLIAGAATMSRIMTAVEGAAKGTIKQADLRYLAEIGIDPQSARRIWAETERTGTRYQDLVLPNTAEWKDYKALRTLHAAMSREDARLVITPGLEKPLWMDASMLGRVIGQFRSFTMAANTKMLVSGLQSRDQALLNTMQGVVFSLALGTVSYYAWAMTVGGDARKNMLEASWEQWLDQAIYRSGLLGAFSEVQVIGAEIPATRPFVSFADDELAGRRPNSILGAVLGPSVGKAEAIAGVLAGFDEPTQGTINTARRLMVWQNVFYLRQGFEAIAEGTSDFFNLPERRQ